MFSSLEASFIHCLTNRFRLNEHQYSNKTNLHSRLSISLDNSIDYIPGINDVSFSRPVSRGSFGGPSTPVSTLAVTNQLNCSMDQSLNQSWMFYQYTRDTDFYFEKTNTPVTNPNKAIITINARTTEVSEFGDLELVQQGYVVETYVHPLFLF